MTDEVDSLSLQVTDARRCVAYLLVAESDQYVAVMDVLEASVTDLTPAEVSRALRLSGLELSSTLVERRLDKLRAWDAVSARTDARLARTRAELLARNWRYTATPAGRQVQRFYRTVLAGAPTMREIPLPSLARVVEGLETFRSATNLPVEEVAEQVGKVFALPGMHANLRRLHSTTGTATGRVRALAFARACADPVHGTAVFNAAVGDHPWRKLHDTADDADLTRVPPWREGPLVAVPEQLARTGRTGARGRASAGRDDAAARERLRAGREERLRDHDAALREVLAADPGARLSERAARVALAALMAAVRGRSRNGRRRATTDGLACTIVHTGRHTGVVAGPTWTVLLPGRVVRFHLPGCAPGLSANAVPEVGRVVLQVEGVA